MKYEKTLKSLCQTPKLTEEQIKLIFKKRDSVDVEVTKKNLGRDGFDIQTDEGRCYVTERPISDLNKKWGRVTALQERMLNLLIPVPLFIGEGTIVRDIGRINKTDDPYKSASEWLHENFTPDVYAAYFNKYFSVSDSLADYKTIIFEAIEAHHMGLDHIAIMSLFPVFEAGLRNIQVSILNQGINTVSTAEFEKGLKELIMQRGRNYMSPYIWHPGKGYNSEVEIDFLTHVNPQCDVINAFRIFFSSVLYKPSGSDRTLNGFNRHLIVHLLKNDFHEPSNFPRIILALTHIMFIESLQNEKVPFFWPGIDQVDMELGSYLRKLTDAIFISRRKLLGSQTTCAY
ncbi:MULTISPECIES: hypothetical protein [Aeromonas]|uniref:hypothetical protein n=1 Tax=Aeromonas TaxID=642 RepID=UPI000FAF6D7C|nr:MULTISPECIES: hypothetical protein [Aeromonas]MCE9955057.1 hypothetical protein [Aeromonas rivipollensis]